MIAVDTNMIVRFLSNDDKNQAKIVASLFESTSVFVSKSVLLETEWVLRACYEISPKNISSAYEKLLGLDNITVEDPSDMRKILELYDKGMDFADAMHLISSKKMDKFLSFDKKLINKAHKLGLKKASLP
jgi:predicted nucleic-acid-binding protein